MTHAWNPEDYHRHSSAQQTWAHELIGKLDLAGDERVLDLGCGEGKVTAEIAARLPSGSVLGLDLSRDMIAFAREHLPPEQYPNLRLIEGDMLDLPFDGEFDVVFSNAALLLPFRPRVSKRMVGGGRPGTWRAASLPAHSHQAVLHVTIKNTVLTHAKARR